MIKCLISWIKRSILKSKKNDDQILSLNCGFTINPEEYDKMKTIVDWGNITRFPANCSHPDFIEV